MDECTENYEALVLDKHCQIESHRGRRVLGQISEPKYRLGASVLGRDKKILTAPRAAQVAGP